jgi:predicted HTH domain antitoxin
MDDSNPDPGAGTYTEITVRIPDELVRLVGASGEVERRVLEALALDEFRQGHLSRAELRRLLGFGTRMKLDEFLAARGVFGTYTLDDLERERRDLQRLGF